MASTTKTPKKPLCFVIGPIGRDGSPERKHADLLLHAVIKEVLEAEEFGYQVKRADEDADPGMIGDRVITDITHAELVVADLTDLNPNAFYELGIRHSTEKLTIHVARSGTQLPFDNVTHRTIFVVLTVWQSIKEGRTRLAASARAINEPDFQVSNPITQANASFKMRQSADPRDRIISELQERLAALEIRSEFFQNRAFDLTADMLATSRAAYSGVNILEGKNILSDLAKLQRANDLLSKAEDLVRPHVAKSLDVDPMRPPSPASTSEIEQALASNSKVAKPHRGRKQNEDEKN